MTKAKVYFSDMRTRYGGLSLPQKLGKLIDCLLYTSPSPRDTR